MGREEYRARFEERVEKAGKISFGGMMIPHAITAVGYALMYLAEVIREKK